MSNYKLESYSWSKALLWGNCFDHAKKAKNEASWGHFFIACVQFIPLVGQIVSIFEKALYSNPTNQMKDLSGRVKKETQTENTSTPKIGINNEEVAEEIKVGSIDDIDDQEVKKLILRMNKYNLDPYEELPNFSLIKEHNKGLSRIEEFAIFAFTTNVYKHMNSLQSGRHLEDNFNSSVIQGDIEEAKAVINELNQHAISGLSKLPNHEATLFRGASLDKNELKKYQLNSEVDSEKFVSYSVAKDTALDFLDRVRDDEKTSVLFEVESTSGKSITKYSAHELTKSMPNEEETLFLPGSKFKVTEIKENAFNSYSKKNVTLIKLKQIY